jgi:hypothetical protein
VYNDWDESAAYEAERKSLTKAQLCADALCTFYSFDAPCGFLWAQTSADEILELVTRQPWRRVHIDVIREEGVEMLEILQGIEFVRAMNEDASNWVQIILKACASGYDPMEASTNSGDISEWLNDVTWDMPELMRRRLESPFLFGKICLELERRLIAIQSSQEGSELS